MALENQVTFAEVGNPKRVTQLTENTDVAGAYFLTEKVGESAAKKTSYATVESAVKSKVQSEYLQTLSVTPASDKTMSEKLVVGELNKRDDAIKLKADQTAMESANQKIVQLEQDTQQADGFKDLKKLDPISYVDGMKMIDGSIYFVGSGWYHFYIPMTKGVTYKILGNTKTDKANARTWQVVDSNNKITYTPNASDCDGFYITQEEGLRLQCNAYKTNQTYSTGVFEAQSIFRDIFVNSNKVAAQIPLLTKTGIINDLFSANIEGLKKLDGSVQIVGAYYHRKLTLTEGGIYAVTTPNPSIYESAKRMVVVENSTGTVIAYSDNQVSEYLYKARSGDVMYINNFPNYTVDVYTATGYEINNPSKTSIPIVSDMSDITNQYGNKTEGRMNTSGWVQNAGSGYFNINKTLEKGKTYRVTASNGSIYDAVGRLVTVKNKQGAVIYYSEVGQNDTYYTPRTSDEVMYVNSYSGHTYNCYTTNLSTIITSYVKDESKIRTTTIRVVAGNDYAIRTAINSITDNSYYNRYIISVAPGRYWEMDIVPKDYVDIVGDIAEDVIIECDYNSSKLTPLDAKDRLSGVSVGGIPINTINKDQNINALHIFFTAGGNFSIKNLTLKAKDFKYCVHHDNANRVDAYFGNCYLIADGCRCVGIGVHNGQKLHYDNCTLSNLNVPTNNYVFGYHNWSKKTEGNELLITNCIVEVGGIVDMQEIGSQRTDKCTIINTLCKDADYSWRITVNNGWNEFPSVLEVPYCIQLTLSNVIMAAGKQVISEGRPNFKYREIK